MNIGVILMYIDTITGILIVIISTFLVWMIKRVVKMIHSLMSSHQSILRSQIVQTYECAKANGGMTLMQKSATEDLYMDYKNLGGNGFVEDLMDKIHKLEELEEK